MKRAAISIITLALLTFMLLTLVGCGSSGSSGSSVVGVYKCKIGEDTAVLTLKAGNQATFSLSEDLAGIPAPYKVEKGSVVIIGGANQEVRFVIEKAGLRDEGGNLYKKQ